MLIIRKRQQEAFDRAVARSLECNLLTHAARQFPDRVRRMGEAGAREWVRTAVAQAGRFGIDDEYEVSRFLDLMFLLGERFFEDQSLPAAAAVLSDEALSPKEKMDRLCELARRHLGPAGAKRSGPAETPATAPRE